MRYVQILTIAAALVAGVSGVNGQDIDNMGALPPQIDSSPGPDLQSAEVDLYTRDGDRPGPVDERTKALKKAAPDLWKVEAAIVVVSSSSCPPCFRQRIELAGPSDVYNVVIYKVDPDDPEDDEKKRAKKQRARDVAAALNVATYPTIMIVEKGVVRKTFLGYTPWGQIRPHAAKARKNGQKGNFRLGPIDINWNDNGNVDIDLRRRDRRR